MVWNLAGKGLQAGMAKAEAKRNRRFQRNMAGSAYQRAMNDMRKAGLNPILAYKQGGAATPAGGQAPVPDFGQGLSDDINSAKGLIKERLERDLIEAQATTAHAMADKLRVETGILKPKETIATGIEAVLTDSTGTAKKAYEKIKSVLSDKRRDPGKTWSNQNYQRRTTPPRKTGGASGSW